MDADLEKAKALREQSLWNEHPEHLREDWKYDVSNDNTLLGYWDWVDDRIEHQDEFEVEEDI